MATQHWRLPALGLLIAAAVAATSESPTCEFTLSVGSPAGYRDATIELTLGASESAIAAAVVRFVEAHSLGPEAAGPLERALGQACAWGE